MHLSPTGFVDDILQDYGICLELWYFGHFRRQPRVTGRHVTRVLSFSRPEIVVVLQQRTLLADLQLQHLQQAGQHVRIRDLHPLQLLRDGLRLLLNIALAFVGLVGEQQVSGGSAHYTSKNKREKKNGEAFNTLLS